MDIIGFLGVAILLTLMPGPDILFVITQSISQGKWAGISTAWGLCTGILVHTTAAALGLSLILYKSALAFQIVKYAGALYLLYLAIIALREKPEILELDSIKVDRKKLYQRGVLMNILNPKVAIFFLALLPQFVDPTKTDAWWQMSILGLVFMVQALCIFTLISIFSAKTANVLVKNMKVARIIKWLKVSVFGGLSIKLALSEIK